MAAVLNTPHLTFLWLTTGLLDPATPFYHASEVRQNAGSQSRFVLPLPTAYKNCHAPAAPYRHLSRRRFLRDFRMALGHSLARNLCDSPDDRRHSHGSFSFSQEKHGPHASVFRRLCDPLRRPHVHARP